MMRPKELRPLIKSGAIYKMSLGKSAIYEDEALKRGALLFQSESRLHDAVVAGDQNAIAKAGALIKSESYPAANAPQSAWRVWANNIRTFLDLPTDSIVLHWEADRDQLFWGIVSDEPIERVRDEPTVEGQHGYFFARKLRDGWRSTSINDVPVSNIHPKARNLAINMATINLVQTDPDFFRALLLDEPIDEWTSRSDWEHAAKQKGWYPKPIKKLVQINREKLVTTQVVQVVDDFEGDVKRMANTAMKTVAYANGQTVITTVKPKDTGMSRTELEDEIGRLFKEQHHKCALTDYDFQKTSDNKHLLPSLDRIDSSLGYITRNLQVVTRAANFYKSASDESDWAEKKKAMEKMAIAIQKHRKSQ